MRQPEQQFWDVMRTSAPRKWWVQRLENAVGSGLPDVLAVHRQVGNVFLELKVGQMPLRKTSRLFLKHGMLTEQIGWHRKYTSMGFCSFIAVRIDGVAGSWGRYFIVNGRDADIFNALTVEQVENEFIRFPRFNGVAEIFCYLEFNRK